MDTIVVCGIFRNAALHMLEWLAFHRLIGVDRFILYDLGSTDGTAALIARSRFNRYVTVIDWQERGGRAEAYAHFCSHHAPSFTWAAIVDPGEFLHPCESDSLRSELPRYDAFSAVVLRRMQFVTAKGPARPGQLTIASDTARVPDDSPANTAALVLIRVKDLRGVQGTPPALSVGGLACNARAEPLSAPAELAQTTEDLLVVNRYLGGVQAGETVADRRITRFIPRLRALLHVPVSEAPKPAPPPAPAPGPPPAPLLLGIGVITYNRAAVLAETLDHIRQRTKHPRTILAAADDGSTDGTLDLLRQQQVLTVTGANSGIAWNKNRALFLLAGVLRCDIVILLEDDAYPSRDNWEIEWMQAAARWGHVNNAPHWLREHFESGAGTPEDPILSPLLSAQCSVFSREAVLFGGYYDTRFRRYGHEHVEHSNRLLRLGYGGPCEDFSRPRFRLLHGGIAYHMVPSSFEMKKDEAEQNRGLAQELGFDRTYRAPWRDEDETRQMRDEMRRTFPRAVL
jgi:hypothetical protein